MNPRRWLRHVAGVTLLSFFGGCAAQEDALPPDSLTALGSAVSTQRELPRFPLGSVMERRRPPKLLLDASGERASVNGPGYSLQYHQGAVDVAVRDEDIAGAAEPFHVMLSAAQFTRGEAALTLGNGRSQQAGRGVERIYDDGVVASINARPEGVEETWRFSNKPAGQGDLVLRLKVASNMTAAADAGELVFYDAAAGAGIRFGRTAWVSGDGTRTVLVPELNGDTIELRVPKALVDSSVYPATLDPLISPSSSSGINYYAPSVAMAPGGTGLTCYENYTIPSTPHIQCRRWTSFGTFTTIDPSSGTAAQYEPDVTYDSATGSFFVVWRDTRNGINQTYLTNITTAGALRDPDRRVSTVAPDNTQDQYSPRIACLAQTQANRNHCNVVWGQITGAGHSEAWTSDFQFRNPSYTYTYVSSGTQEVGVGVADTTLENYAPSTAADTTNFLTVWEKDVDGLGQTKIRGTVMAPGACTVEFLPTIATAGDLTGGLAFSETGNQTSPHVTWNGNTGTGYISYVTDRSGNRNVRIRRISYSFSGCTMSSNAGGTGVDVSVAAADQDFPMIACTANTIGSTCGVIFGNGSSPMSVNARLFTTSNSSPYLSFAAPMFQVGGTATKRQTPRMGASSSQFGVVYDQRTGIRWQVGGNTVSNAGAVGTAGGIIVSP